MLFTKEPAVILKVIEELVRAAIPLALIFGWVQWTDPQVGAVMLFVGVLVGGLTTLFVRSQTVAVKVADKQIEIAKAADANTSTEKIIKQAREEV